MDGSPVITSEYTPLSTGVIKQRHDDFIVQEIGADGVVAELVGEKPSSSAPLQRAVLTKKGLSTTEACHLLAAHLDIPSNLIQVHGKKDVFAHTAQFFTIPYATTLPATLDGITIHSAIPALSPARLGEHQGNQFTITVREHQLSEASLRARIDHIHHVGVRNYFDSQRFGPRQHNHLVGEALASAKYDRAGELLLYHATLCEPGETLALRKRLPSQSYAKQLAIVAEYRHELRSEYELLETLLSGKTARDFWYSHIPQARFFANAYGSYLWNNAVAQFSDENLPDTFPTLSSDPSTLAIYNSLLEAIPATGEGSLRLRTHLRATRVYPKISYSFDTETLQLTFSLPPAAYATQVIRAIISPLGVH
jgi:TruD family tRNA pseudouridine synthase